MSKHILLVTIDSLRGDHLGCYGERDIRTPNLDAFAGAGVRFHHHLSTLATTLPSHTSLMTGCVPSVHGINWNGVDRPRRRQTLAEIAASEEPAMVEEVLFQEGSEAAKLVNDIIVSAYERGTSDIHIEPYEHDFRIRYRIDGVLYEVSGRHLAGKQLSVWTDGLTGKLLRATWQDQPVRVGLCDPVANRSRPRPKTPAPAPIRKTTPFDPIAALLQKAREEVPHD